MPHDPHEHSETHGHSHDHDDHAAITIDDKEGYYQHLADATRELLIEKGYFSNDDVRQLIEKADARSPALGAKIVAKAWTDPAYRDLLLTDGRKALKEVGIEDLVTADLLVVENTPDVHNTIVCTLCSCYPTFVLGRPPAWYKSAAYRKRVVREPRAVLKEFGTEIASDRELRVHDSTADMRYLVLPMRPPETEGWSAEELEKIVTRDTMVGTAEVRVPQ